MIVSATLFRTLLVGQGVVVGVMLYVLRSDLNLAIIGGGIVSLIGYLLAMIKPRSSQGITSRLKLDQIIEPYFYSLLEFTDQALVVIDRTGRITFANALFEELISQPRQQFLKKSAKELPWKWQDQETSTALSWTVPLRETSERTGFLQLEGPFQTPLLKLRPRSIESHSGTILGVLCLFSPVDLGSVPLSDGTEPLLAALRKSASHIRQKNQELETLALIDPVTGVYNRRTGLELLDSLWISATENREGLACAMIDIDHFRKINTQLGRARADKVLHQVAEMLLSITKPDGIVCRYGGEEFLAIFPRTSLLDAYYIAERIRSHVSRSQKSDLDITVSIGISGWQPHYTGVENLIEDAELHLEYAKQRGRNIVVKDPADHKTQQTQVIMTGVDQLSQRSIEGAAGAFSTLIGLFSVIAGRDHELSLHSLRVYELCLSAAQHVMSRHERLNLESAALLHEFWRVMQIDQQHFSSQVLYRAIDRTPHVAEIANAGSDHVEGADVQGTDVQGADAERADLDRADAILRNSFGSVRFTEIIKNSRIPYLEHSQSEMGSTLSTKILAVADRYDSLIYGRDGFSKHSLEDAAVELRRLSGTHFDAEIVTQFLFALPVRPRAYQPMSEDELEPALKVCKWIDSFAEAMDHQDLEWLQRISRELAITCLHESTFHIKIMSTELDRAIAEGDDQLGILQIGHDIFEACHAIKMSYLWQTLYQFSPAETHSALNS